MSNLKIGDRVAVYTPRGRETGVIDSELALVMRVKLSTPVGAEVLFCHPKQLRRLKPKAKPRLVRDVKAAEYAEAVLAREYPEDWDVERNFKEGWDAAADFMETMLAAYPDTALAMPHVVLRTALKE